MPEQEPRKKHVISVTVRTCFRIGLTIFLVYLAISLWNPLLGVLGNLISAAASLIIGCALAYVVNILMSVYERHYFRKRADQKWVKATRRPFCLIFAIATVVGVILVILAIVLPQLNNALSVIKEKIPDIMKEISENEKIMNLLPEGIQEAIKALDFEALVNGIISFLTNGSSASETLNLANIVGAITSGFTTGFMGFIFSIYILIGKERLSKQFGRFFRSYLSNGWVNKIKAVGAVADESFHNFIVGQVTEAFIIGVLCGVGMWIIRLPYAAMIGTVVGVTALIPILGCYLGAIIGALMCLSVGLWTAVEFLIFIFCLQQFEDNLIYPRVVGTSLGLPAIWVMAAVSIGGGIGGLLGMILAVPVFSTIYQLVRMGVRKRESQKGKYLTAADLVAKMKRESET